MSLKPTCLLVDDEPGVRGFVCTVLRNSGFDVIEAADGVQGLAEFHNHPDGLDCVVTDVSLPGMDGLTLAAKIRSERPRMPIVLISGFTDVPGSGEIPLLRKPFLPAHLLSTVQQVISGMALGLSA
jgi:DNA-binding response OmpR family regulator